MEVKLEDVFRIDMLVNDVVIVELKSVESLPNVAAKQLKTYLSLTGVKLGILINFGEKSLKDGIKQIVVSQ
jgi:GxxExxY protein